MRVKKGYIMWIFTNNAMLSLVEDRDDPTLLVVRARLKGDIERVFPDFPAITVGGSDYKWRTWVPKSIAAKVIADSIREIDYGNFKDSINKEDKLRKSAYLDVWADMLEAQNEENEVDTDDWIQDFYKQRYSRGYDRFYQLGKTNR